MTGFYLYELHRNHVFAIAALVLTAWDSLLWYEREAWDKLAELHNNGLLA